MELLEYFAFLVFVNDLSRLEDFEIFLGNGCSYRYGRILRGIRFMGLTVTQAFANARVVGLTRGATHCWLWIMKLR